MSDWLRLVNEMKRRAPQEYFTPTQRSVYDALVERLQFPNQRINLYGAPGTGKTYLAWGLARALEAVHVPVASRLREFDGRQMPILILDNAPTYEDEERSLLADAALMDAGSVVFITQKPTALKMRRIQLDLPNSDDLRQIARTLGRLGFYEVTALPPSPNLWQLLQCYV
jgi:tRNA A37 threonylcarbamoyladenosine biosynthesis protein TsaE